MLYDVFLGQTLKIDFGKVFKGKSDKNPKNKTPSNAANVSKKKPGVGASRPPLK